LINTLPGTRGGGRARWGSEKTAAKAAPVEQAILEKKAGYVRGKAKKPQNPTAGLQQAWVSERWQRNPDCTIRASDMAGPNVVE